MKKCPHCGAEYPDEVAVCPVDQTPVEAAHSAEVSSCAAPLPVTKPKPIVIGAVLLLVVLYWAVIRPATQRAERRRRAELHLLDTIKGELSNYLDTGGALPTNWMALSHAVTWEHLDGISHYNHLPPPTALYTVLRKPVDLNNSYHSVFLVRAEPCRWHGGASGRWVLGVGFGFFKDSTGKLIATSHSNQLYRTWAAEKDLPADIRSQLAN